jgi:flagellar motor switch protein FliN
MKQTESAASNVSDMTSDSGAVATVDDGATTNADYSELDRPIGQPNEVPIGMLMDLTLPVSIELGRTKMSVQEILQLGRGSIVQLERLAGEPIDIFVGERRFAEGEVVVLGENFGVRVTRILSRATGPELLG